MRIVTFVVRRLAAGLFTWLVMLTLTFVVFWAIPQRPESFVYPNAPNPMPAFQIHKADQLLGLDRSKLDQYFDYISHDLRFDFGSSWSGSSISPQQTLVKGPPVGPYLYGALRRTLSLVLGGAFFVLLLGIPLGTIAGSRVGSLADRTISIVTLVAVCLHPMILGLLLRSLFGHRLHWAPESGYCPLVAPGKVPAGFQECSGVGAWAAHLALPWLTFALLFLALYTRMIRASVAETLPEDYVRTARAKGASEVRVLSRHVLPNAGLKVLTMIGMEIGTAIGVCIYLETVFGIGGLGQLAVFQLGGQGPLDLPSVLALVTMLTLVVVIGNIVVDVLYAVIDPRAGRIPIGRGEKSLAGGVI